jgi:hypothetical protein
MRPLNFTVKQHAMSGADADRILLSAYRNFLWLSCIAAAWAWGSHAWDQPSRHIPYLVQLLMLMSGAITLVGGCLAMLYLVIGARRPTWAILGAAAAFANFWYAWLFISSL